MHIQLTSILSSLGLIMQQMILKLCVILNYMQMMSLHQYNYQLTGKQCQLVHDKFTLLSLFLMFTNIKSNLQLQTSKDNNKNTTSNTSARYKHANFTSACMLRHYFQQHIPVAVSSVTSDF